MRVDLDRTGGRAPRDLIRIQTLAVAAGVLCGLAATLAVAGSREETQPEPPVYFEKDLIV